MSATVFNSAFWFQNEIYQDFEDKVYANKKQIREDFEEFLIENLKELEFKKKKKKSKHSDNICYEYTFEEDKNHKIRVTDDSEGIHIIPLYKNKLNEDISEEIVDRDKGEIFRQLMDRILDALEVIECEIFDIETKTQTNLKRTPNQIKRGKDIAAKLSSKKGGKKYNKKDETTEEFDPEEEESEEEQEEEDESESFEELEVSKRRSKRLRKRKKKINRKRKRNDSDSEGDEDNNDDSDSDNDNNNNNNNKPKRKRRKLNKVEFKAMKKEFIKSWGDKEYVEAIHFAEDEYNMTSKEINDLIEDIYDDDL